jgi:hypothetical protein
MVAAMPNYRRAMPEPKRRNALRLLMWWTAPAPGIEVP